MSIEWFRWYHDTVTDPKLALIARKVGQPRPVVVAVWAALLECASKAPERGDISGFDAETIAIALDLDEEAIPPILATMTTKGMILDGRITAWEKRQVAREREDDSKQRVRRYREKLNQVTPGNATVTPGNATVTPGNATVTPGNATVTPVTPPRERVDKDTDKEERRGRKEKEKENNAHARKTACPPDLAITPELQAWANEHGYHEDLARHLDCFRDKAIAKGYQYADWIAAFRNAVRDDWAGLRTPHPQTRRSADPPPPPSPFRNPRADEFDAILRGEPSASGRIIEGVLADAIH